MDFFEAVQKRQSIRKFTGQAVSKEQLKQILEAANRAPSAGNLQAYKVFVVKEFELRQILARAAGGQDCIAEAPLVLVFCADPTRSAAKYGSRGEQLYCIQDATIACCYAQLAITALGLATVWIGAVHEPEVLKDALKLKEDLWPIALLPIGYPAETPEKKPRRKLSDLVHELLG